MSEPANDTPRTIGSRRIHEGAVISLDADTVRLPGGRTTTIDVVRHRGACAVVPFLTAPTAVDPVVLLIKQYRHATGSWLLEIPAGRLDPNESPEDCARRELREETGCTAADMTHMTSVWTTPGFSDERIHLFMATGLTRGSPAREVDELIEPTPLALTDALERISRGEICDAKTVAALLFAAGFRAAP